jgi:hypothetical protein
VGVPHSQRQGEGPVSKSNWRDEKTKIRTIDTDPGGKKSCHVLHARMLIRDKEDDVGENGMSSEPQILNIYFI